MIEELNKCFDFNIKYESNAKEIVIMFFKEPSY